MPKFLDLKIAIAIKIIIVAITVYYVRQNSSHVTVMQVDQHLVK
ncbi:MAG: hypothetical protein NT128_04300 [Proteobacteria bacterium]|nr:hypothetical protein [Pseudomonadota bacterium]